MFIKICGLSTPETVQTAVDAGVDAVGFVLAPGYARTVSPQQVRSLIADIPPEIETVGVFRNQPIDDVSAWAQEAGVDSVQLHGEEPFEDVEALEQEGYGVLRAFPAQTFVSFSRSERERWTKRRILLDAVQPGQGLPFDPRIIMDNPPEGFWLLAGGLTSHNVTEFTQLTHPTGVDVSSGVEVSKGVKSSKLIEEFITTVRSLQREG